MRKKLTALILAGSIAVCTFTACGITGGGDVVSKNEWQSAFSKTLALKNYTLKTHIAQLTALEFSGGDGTYVMTAKYSYDDVVYVNSDRVYAVCETVKSVSGVPEDVGTYENYSETEYVSAYSVKDNNVVYRTVYSSIVNTAEENEEKPEWVAESVSNLISVSTPLNDNTYRLYETGETTTLSELYSIFDYVDGYYHCEMYHGSTQENIYISFKDGYVSKIMSLYYVGIVGSPEVSTYKTVYEFSNIQDTEVNPDPAALDSIDKLING